MGTRSLTVFTDDKEEIVVMYRQMDGYISQHGKELAEFLQQFDEITTGLRLGDERKLANGMGCLASQTIMHFKGNVKEYSYDKERVFDSSTGIMGTPIREGHHAGGIYLQPAGTRDCGEEYIYYITEKKGSIHLRACFAGCPERIYGTETFPARADRVIFDGAISKWNLTDVLNREKTIVKQMDDEWKAEQELTQ